MAQGDRRYSSLLVPGAFYEQADTTFTETEMGQFDTGVRLLLTHPSTTADNSDFFPKVGQRHDDHPYMQIFNVDQTKEESGLKALTITYRGCLYTEGGDSTKSDKLIGSVSTQIVSIPAMTGGGDSQPRSLIVPIPMPVLTRRFITTNNLYSTDPYIGVGHPSSQPFLPPAGSWSISYLPDPDQIPPAKYYQNVWLLMDRTVENAAKGLGHPPVAWMIEETYQWEWNFSA